MFGQLMGILKTTVFSTTVGDEPRHLVRFVGGIVPHLIQRHLFVSLVIIHPLLIGSHNVAVRPVGGCPVEHIVVSDMLCVIWTLKEV